MNDIIDRIIVELEIEINDFDLQFERAVLSGDGPYAEALNAEQKGLRRALEIMTGGTKE